MFTHDSTFEFLPLPALRWAAPCAARPLAAATFNRAFGQAYALESLPELYAHADGSHTLRLQGRCGSRPLCRVYLSTLPDRSRLGIIENVQDDYQDSLTGLETRRALRLDAGHMQHMGLAMLDIDGFKRVNDMHGHAAGDAVLVALAELLGASASAWGARAYRLGGDEFVILGPALLDAGQLSEVQAQFRCSAARSGLKVQGFSYGLSRAPHDGQTLCELLERADIRLMKQKIDRRGAAAAHLLRHFQERPEPKSPPAGQGPDPDPERRPFQISWPEPPRPYPRCAESR